MNIHKSIIKYRKVESRLERGLDVTDQIKETKELAGRFSNQNLTCSSLTNCVECQYVPTDDSTCVNSFVTPCALTNVVNSIVNYDTTQQVLNATFTLSGNISNTTKIALKDTTPVTTETSVTSSTTTLSFPITYAEYINTSLHTTGKFINTNCVWNVNIPRTYSCAGRDITYAESTQIIDGRKWFVWENELNDGIGATTWTYSVEDVLFDKIIDDWTIKIAPKQSEYLNILGVSKFIGMTATDEFICPTTEYALLNIHKPYITLEEPYACHITGSAFRIVIPYTITNALTDVVEIKTVDTSIDGSVSINSSAIVIQIISPTNANFTGSISIGYVGSSTVWDTQNFAAYLDSSSACLV